MPPDLSVIENVWFMTGRRLMQMDIGSDAHLLWEALRGIGVEESDML